jgi:carboxypeptidase Taq
MIASDSYTELERRFGRHSAINRASAILNWDRSTMMPEGASEDRADQLATLSLVAHEIMAAPDMAELLARAEEGRTSLDLWRAANLREMPACGARTPCPPTWSRRAFAPPPPARWCGGTQND